MTNDDPSNAADNDGRCRKLMDISGAATAVELLELGPETDTAMLRYQVEYADAFAFVFSLYSPKTLETAQRLRDKVAGAARNHHNIITMSDYERPGMTVPVFLIGNRDEDLAPPQGKFQCSPLTRLEVIADFFDPSRQNLRRATSHQQRSTRTLRQS